MLIEFSVKNFRSIKDRQTFSMVASSGSELRQNTVEPEGQDLRLVRSAALYGPNAAGKSNFIAALQTMKSIVVSSAKESSEGENVPVKPFLFNRSTKRGPTEFEAIFVQGGIKYQFGYATTRKRIVEEWLIAYPTPRAQTWYERSFSSTKNEEDWYFGGKLTGNRLLWRDSTRTNALYLSTAVQLNSRQLKPVYEWFDDTLRIIGGGNLHPSFTVHCWRSNKYKEGIQKFLRAADVGISGVKIDTRELSAAELPSHLDRKYRELILKDFEGKEVFDVSFLHTVGDDGDTVSLDIEEESAGTRKLFAFSGPLFDVLDHGYVLVVDELNNSLHPLMTRFLINLFHDASFNKNNAQLIFSTHDTSNLDEKLFRRDQIWLVESTVEERATTLNPLTDFRPRKGVEPFERNYLLGRYGALPFFEALGNVGGKPH